MNEPQIGNGLSDVKVETNFTPAPVEQQSTETQPVAETIVPTETETPAAIEPAVEAPVVTERPAQPVADDKANAAAREAIRDRLRAEDAERRLKEMQPKSAIPTQEPDINDQKTWGDKYKDAPNDLDTFKKAYADWAREDGRRLEREAYTQAEKQKADLAMRTEVARKEQESRAKHADYDAVINPIVPVINSVPLLKDFIAKNAMGTEVAYELAKNPTVLDQLMRSNVWEAGEQLLNMAARLKAPKPVEITQAPEPINPVGTRETVRPKLADLAQKDIGAYIATRNKQELAKRRAN